MNNFYILYGTDKSIITNEVNKIIDKLKTQDIIKYSMDNTMINSIVEDASTISMFSSKKVIILDNCAFLTSGKNIDKIEILENYLDNYNKDTYIIFIAYTEKLDSRKKIVSKLSKISKVIELKRGDNNYLKKYIEDILKENKYSIESIDYLLSKTGTNLDNIKNELDKLIIYKSEDKKILNKDIDLIVMSTMEDEIFSLTDAIIAKDTTKSLYLMNEFLNRSYDETGLIILIANQFRFMYQVKRLLNKGNNNTEIAKILEVNPYRVKFTIQKLYYYTEDILIDYIKELGKMDREIKLGNINKRLALEMFIINNKN